MVFDITDRVHEAWKYYDELLDERIAAISELSEVPAEQIVKINPAEFIERNKFQVIRGYEYSKLKDFIKKYKVDDHTYLVSPVDAIEETAAQISYKSGTEIRSVVRASKCCCVPCPMELALDFFIHNHRQSAPNYSAAAVCFGLTLDGELIAVMFYDISNGAVRGKKKDYELVRLAIRRGTRIHGGASKLQQACEDTLRKMGEKRIYSYSNATINSGAVYEKLGFRGDKVDTGQPFVIMEDNSITRLINLFPASTDEMLAAKGRIKTHVGGNKMWVKDL